MAGEDLDAVRELEQAAQRVKEVPGARLCSDREVGTGSVADEERVAGEDEPRLLGPRAVDHRDTGVLGPVPRRVDRPQHHLAELDLGAVVQRIVLELRLGGRVDRDRDTVLERQPPVPGQVIGMRVRLDRPHDPDVALLRLRQHRLDRVRRIDDRRDTRVLVADQVRRTAEIVVNELLEEHEQSRYQALRRARRSATAAKATARNTPATTPTHGKPDLSRPGATVSC